MRLNMTSGVGVSVGARAVVRVGHAVALTTGLVVVVVVVVTVAVGLCARSGRSLVTGPAFVVLLCTVTGTFAAMATHTVGHTGVVA